MEVALKKRLRSFLLTPRRAWWNVQDQIDRCASEKVLVRDIRSICLMLGPYRNLTTLTAAVLFLHPNCQVLNHAGDRIIGRDELDFLSEFSSIRLDRFAQYAIKISNRGRRGTRGGSITVSHAFLSNPKILEAFERANLDIVKPHIQSLFWKESLRVSQLLRSGSFDIESALAKDERLRFMLPIRNPIDCAVSNIRTRHVRLFPGLSRESNTIEVVRAILDEIFWFADLEKAFPERFLSFTQTEVSPGLFAKVCQFLEMSSDDTWISTANDLMQVRSRYKHDQDLIEQYQAEIYARRDDYPELVDRLSVFGNS